MKDLKKAWRTLAQYHFKNEKKFWLLESKMQRNEGKPQTAQYCRLNQNIMTTQLKSLTGYNGAFEGLEYIRR